jgi:hypothetical protein
VSSTALSRILLIGTGLATLALVMIVASGPARPLRLGPVRFTQPPSGNVTLEQQMYGISPDRLILIAPPGFTDDSRR